jgi:hypothetical protein
VAAVSSEHYQAFTGNLAISLSDPSPINYTAATVTGRITVQLRKADGSVPDHPETYRVRLKDPTGQVIPSTGYNVFDASGNFTFAPLDIGTYTWAARPATGTGASWPNPYWTVNAPTIATGVSVPYIIPYTVP